MAIINSYPSVTPKATDLLLISDVSEQGNPTKTVTINSVLALGTGSGGGITTIQSANTNYLSVTDPQGPVVTLDLNVGAVVSGGDSLATTGDIYSFTTTSITNAINNLGTIGTVTNFAVDSTAIAAFTTSVSNPTTTPILTIGITGSPGATKYLDGTGNWTVPGGTGAMSSWRLTGDGSTISNIVDNDLVTFAGGTKITTSAALTDTLTITHDATTTTPTTSSSSPGASGTFDAIDSITYDSTGHITGFNTNTVTLPAAGGGGGSGTVTSVGLDVTGVAFLSSTPAFVTSSGTFTVTASGTSSQYVKGDGSLGTIADIAGTTYDLTGTATGSNYKVVLTGSDSTVDDVIFEAGAGITLADQGSNTVQIAAINNGTVTSVDAGNTSFIDGATSTSPNPITTTGTLSYSLSATGTPSSSTFLRGDNAWATPPTVKPPIYFSIQGTTTSNIQIINNGNISSTLVDCPQGFGPITVTAGGGNISNGIKVQFASRTDTSTDYMVTATCEAIQGTTDIKVCAVTSKAAKEFTVVYNKAASGLVGFGTPVLTNIIIYK